MVKDAMNGVAYGDRTAMVEAIFGAIKAGGLFSVDVDIVPTKISEAAHVILPAATSGEANLTSMNGERRMRLTERYMDPPGQAKPDCLIAAGLANHLEAAFRTSGKHDLADKFKGFDWKTEEDAFMDGYHANAKGGEFVTYGIVADGEEALSGRISYGIPDVLERDRQKYIGRSTLVVGGGCWVLGR